MAELVSNSWRHSREESNRRIANAYRGTKINILCAFHMLKISKKNQTFSIAKHFNKKIL